MEHTNQLTYVVGQIYGLGRLEATRTIEQGVNDTWYVRTEKGKYFVKKYQKQTTIIEVEEEGKIIMRLIEKGFPTIAPLSTLEGDYLYDGEDGRIWTILPWLNAHQPSESMFIENLEMYIAAAANATKILGDITTEKAAQLKRKRVAQRLTSLQIPSEDIALIKALRQEFPSMAWGYIHKDIQEENILIDADDKNMFYVIDFEGMQKLPLLLELVRPIRLYLYDEQNAEILFPDKVESVKQSYFQELPQASFGYTEELFNRLILFDTVYCALSKLIDPQNIKRYGELIQFARAFQNKYM